MRIGSLSRTYGEIDISARRWAARIVRALDRQPERIGVFAYRSEVGYIGTLAALFAGAAFVPLNRTFPVDRTLAMAREARLDAIIVDSASAVQLGDILSGLHDSPVVIAPEGVLQTAVPSRISCFAGSELDDVTPLADLPPVMLDDIAYLLFTSGSTGTPKGVPVTHANIVYFLDIMQRRFEIQPEDRFSQTFAQTFDVSVFDLFMAWEHGASVHGMRQIDLLAPTTYINENSLTIWFSVPSVVSLMRRKSLLRSGSMPKLRYSLFAGEPLSKRSAELWQEAAPNSVVENLYGPTELTIVCTGYRWDPRISARECQNEMVPIGRPFDGLCALVLGPDGETLLDDQEGELCIAGPQTFPGYWLNDDRTLERFIDLPLSDTRRRRFYRTGDRVVRGSDGVYHYRGRIDHQVKVMGFRVELSEIEGVLAQDPRVISAVAFGWPIVEGRATGIVAFVSGSAIDTRHLLGRAAQALPPYMVPRDIRVLDAMPLNVNGKIDRQALLDRLSLALE